MFKVGDRVRFNKCITQEGLTCSNCTPGSCWVKTYIKKDGFVYGKIAELMTSHVNIMVSDRVISLSFRLISKHDDWFEKHKQRMLECK